jgi:hypothetical protein
MASDLLGGAAPAGSTRLDRGAAITRFLLAWGLVVGPLYLGLGLAQALIRDGFDLARHPLSALANGIGGWVQTLNLALSGIMVIAAAVGFRRVLGARSRGVVWCMMGFGLGMIVAAAFPMDPSDGFPVGTPEGMPTSVSASGIVHFAAGGLGFLSLAISCFFMAAAMRRRLQPALARFSLVAGIVIPFALMGGMMFQGPGIIGIWLSVVTEFLWIGVMARHLYRVSPDPTFEPA